MASFLGGWTIQSPAGIPFANNQLLTISDDGTGFVQLAWGSSSAHRLILGEDFIAGTELPIFGGNPGEAFPSIGIAFVLGTSAPGRILEIKGFYLFGDGSTTTPNGTFTATSNAGPNLEV